MLFSAFMVVLASLLNAQVTTSGMSGKVVASGESVIGATIQAIHESSGTRYGTVTNVDGRFTLQGMRTGGPYRLEVSYVGYQTAIYKDVNLRLGENYVLNVSLKESSEILNEVVVVASASSNMKSDRAGAITNIGKEAIASVPTVSRSMNDIMRLSPQSNTTSNGFAVGGGNYRQSYVTVDGAAFNNAFGIGQNLPANGSPISLDALEQISVSVTPYDVRQSGFTGGAINAVTRSGDNEFKGTVYSFLNNEKLKGRKVDDYKLTRTKSQYNTYGASIGGPIIKDKLFFFVNGEYEDNITAGPSYTLRNSTSESFGTNNVVRPLLNDVETMKTYLNTKYGYDPGRYTGYSIDTPAFRLLGRLDWNINESNKLSLRFSKTRTKDSNSPSSSVSPLTANSIYPGDSNKGISKGYGRTSNYSMYFESSRYYQERNFTSVAGEWNSRLLGGKLNNMLRFAYSYQDEPRSYEGGEFPTVDILQDGASYASFGPDPFTAGNLREVSTYVVTDELNWNWGNHSFLAGLQYESNDAVNGFMQAGNGYYVFSSWSDFVNGEKPSAFGITHSNSADLSQFQAKLKYQQYSAYVQDQMNLTPNFKITAGVRFELPYYPSLDNNYNAAFAKLDFGGNSYSTDQLPGKKITVSPRVGFNWDITGERKYVVRGGTGVFVGRLPFVWLVSAVSNSNVGQTQLYYNTQADAIKYGYKQPDFHSSVKDILTDLYGGSYTLKEPTAPSSPTIIDKDLKMPSTWKTSLAFDAKLPYDIDFTLEGIYNKDFNPAIISNPGYKADGTVQLSPNDTRTKYSQYIGGKNVYLIENGKNDAYYYSISAQLRKKFNFGLDLSLAYTHSYAKSYSDGIGDQVTSAYKTNTSSINGINDHELGYGTYVAPDRIIASIGYRKEYAKNFASSISLIYDGSQIGYSGGYSYSRYSYTFGGNVVKDGGANNLLYVPSSREELDQWNFADQSNYTAKEQKDDFWAYINQDDYLKGRKGKYTERGGAIMPWHHQLDFKFNQDFYVNVAGKRNTIQFGVDIQNLPNLLNNSWGLYKATNSTNLLNYSPDGKYTFNKVNNEVLTNTYKKYQSFSSTYSVQFSIRYIFN